MTSRDDAHTMRGIVARAVVRATNDNAGTQTAEVTVYRDVQRSGVEVLQPFGFASRPRAGSLAVVLSVGADQGDLVALPISDPADRMGGLEEGEAAFYAADGSRVHIKADGTIDVVARTALVATVEGVSMRLSAEGVAFTGGTVTHNGKNIGDTHVHGEVTPGSADTGVPSN